MIRLITAEREIEVDRAVLTAILAGRSVSGADAILACINSGIESEYAKIDKSSGCDNCDCCMNCDGCDTCKDCVECVNCENCCNCLGCIDCSWCDKCTNCLNCENCEGLVDCVGWRNNKPPASAGAPRV